MKAKDGDNVTDARLTVGPVLFHWPAEQKRDFYFRIADEAPVDTVYIGETVCSKRAPFFEKHYPEVMARLQKGGKTVVLSSLAEIMTKRERDMTGGLCTIEDCRIEANDAAALFHLRGKPHYVGQFFNTYNEDTLAYLARGGACHVTLPAELPAQALATLARKAKTLGISLEVQVYGRMPLALSARCYHARAHDRVKDNCQFVCEKDPDGMVLKTVDKQPFLAVNGVQTLSYSCLNLMAELEDMQEMGLRYFRLSPQSHDMTKTAKLFRAVLDKKTSANDATARLAEIGLDTPHANGFYHGAEGHRWLAPAALHAAHR